MPPPFRTCDARRRWVTDCLVKCVWWMRWGAREIRRCAWRLRARRNPWRGCSWTTAPMSTSRLPKVRNSHTFHGPLLMILTDSRWLRMVHRVVDARAGAAEGPLDRLCLGCGAIGRLFDDRPSEGGGSHVRLIALVCFLFVVVCARLTVYGMSGGVQLAKESRTALDCAG